MNRRQEIRLHLEVLWIFRIKARLNKCGARISDEERLSEFPEDSFEIERMYRADHYEPHALFGGRLYLRQGQVIEAGKLLAQGYSNSAIQRLMGVDTETVSKLRRFIVAYRGRPFYCQCGDLAGHQNKAGCYINRRTNGNRLIDQNVLTSNATKHLDDRMQIIQSTQKREG